MGAIAAAPTPKPKPKPGQPIPTETVVTPTEASNTFAGVAETFMEQNRYDSAISWFKKSVDLNKDNLNAKIGLSEALTKKGDEVFDKDGAEAAIPIYNNAIVYNANNSGAYAALGNAYDETNDAELSFQNYDKALKINPNLTELYALLGGTYYQKGDYAKADELLTKAISFRAEDDQTQYLLGLIRYKQLRYPEASIALQNSLKIKETAEGHYYLGEVYDRMDKDKEALAEYDRAVALNPKYTEAWFDLGAANYNRGRLEDSANAYKQASLLKNNDAEIRENLGDVYRQMKRYDDAINEYRLATTLIEANKPKDRDVQSIADLYSKYGFVLARAEKWANTTTALNKAVSINPDNVDYTNLGWAFYNAAQVDVKNKNDAAAKEKFIKAKDALEKAATLNSQNPGTYMNLGLTLTDMGDFQAATDAFKKCIQLKEKWVPAYNELGYAYRMMNDYDTAIKNFKKAEDLDKTYYPAIYNLAESEFRRGNEKEARKVQDRLRKINPGMANQLEAIFRGAVLRTTSDTIQNKVNEKNPLNQLPKIAKIPY